MGAAVPRGRDAAEVVASSGVVGISLAAASVLRNARDALGLLRQLLLPGTAQSWALCLADDDPFLRTSSTRRQRCSLKRAWSACSMHLVWITMLLQYQIQRIFWLVSLYDYENSSVLLMKLTASSQEQRQCVEFFIKCTGVLASVSFEHDNIALNLFIEHFFSVIHPAIIRPNVRSRALRH